MTPDESLDLKAARLLLNTTQDLEAKGWYHSLELPNGEVIQGTQSLDRLERRLSMLPIPQDLRGKRVLDIGAWDGWFSFAMERRGAEVLAADFVDGDQHGFQAGFAVHVFVEFEEGDVADVAVAE